MCALKLAIIWWERDPLLGRFPTVKHCLADSAIVINSVLPLEPHRQMHWYTQAPQSIRYLLQQWPHQSSHALSQMLELGRQMETELHTGTLGAPAPTASAALGMGGGKGARARTAGATAKGLGGAGGTGGGAAAETGDSGKHHAGLLSETEESRSRSRGAKVGYEGHVLPLADQS